MNYYTKQLQQVTGENKAFTILSDTGDTDILKLNLESIAALQKWLDIEKNRLIDALPVNHMTQKQREHNIGLALAALLSVQRSEEFPDRFNTAIGNKTAYGLYSTVKRVLNDSPEYPKLSEIFPKFSKPE